MALRDNLARRVCADAIFCAAAMMLSYLEVLLPLNLLVPIPGFRLGLANVAILLVFCLISPLDAGVVSLLRILLMGVLFGSVTSLWFSFLGGLLSYLVLFLLSKVGKRMSFFGVSVLCAAAHNTGQVIAAGAIFGWGLIYSYLPALLFASAIYGGVVGVILNLLLPRLAPRFHRARREG